MKVHSGEPVFYFFRLEESWDLKFEWVENVNNLNKFLWLSFTHSILQSHPKTDADQTAWKNHAVSAAAHLGAVNKL